MDGQLCTLPLKIFVFSWNTQSVAFNKGNADFVPILREKIVDSECDLVVVGLQEDSMKESDLLTGDTGVISADLAEHGFDLVHTVSLSGWGATTYKALRNEWKYLPRGLRLGVFKRRASGVVVTDVDARSVLCPGWQNWVTYGKGGVVINLKTSAGSIAFLNVHLPFNSQSVHGGVDRHGELLWQAQCLRHLWNFAVDTFASNALFVFGDLNFRVRGYPGLGAKEMMDTVFSDPLCRQKVLRENDELTFLRGVCDGQGYLLPEFFEGDLTFLPTCKLKQGRGGTACTDNYSFGKANKRVPSWCDRILWTSERIRCLSYDRMDVGSMNLSDHCAVFGVYILE